MPSNVVWFERLMYGGLLLVLVSGYFVVQRELPALAEEIGLGYEVLIGIAFIFVAILVLIRVLFIWLAARRRKGWARYVLGALFVVGLILYLRSYEEIIDNPLEGALNGLQLVMELVALVLAFTGNAREWFARPAPAHFV